jgi:hypothetical protein
MAFTGMDVPSFAALQSACVSVLEAGICLLATEAGSAESPPPHA